MKRIWILSITIVAAIAAFSLIPFGASGSQNNRSKAAGEGDRIVRTDDKTIPNRYIVVLNEDADDVYQANSERAADDLAASYGGRKDKEFNAAFRGFTVEMSPASAARLSRDSRVRYITEDIEVSISGTQTPVTWGLDRVDQRHLPLSSSYTYGSTGAGVNVYVLDSGIRTTHSEFGGRAVNVFDAFMDGQNGNDCNGHGTHVAGTIGGITHGVAKEVNIYGLRVLGCNGVGSLSNLLAGIDWVVANRIEPAIVNLSLGTAQSDLLDWTVENAIAEGITFIAAAGNSAKDACTVSPARAPGAITVGASDQNDQMASFSNFGPCLDIFAPGVEIMSASMFGDGIYQLKNGTSMAAPHVSGAAALYLQKNPLAKPDEVATYIRTRSTTGAMSLFDTGSPNRLLITEPLSPTAANAMVTGTVVNSNGRGINGVKVAIANLVTGERQVKMTNNFGIFYFEDLEAGQYYQIVVAHRRMSFSPSEWTFGLHEDLTDLVFTAY